MSKKNNIFKKTMRKIKTENHYDDEYVTCLKSGIFMAHMMGMGAGEIIRGLEEVGFDEPVRSALREYSYKMDEMEQLEVDYSRLSELQEVNA
ncbi:hypothetical protein [Butyrivibrio sp. FC2001]|uniref:hypothetical protein n=1 Tax=Butyrivibrio sp. FC2001 TaxID=1280671 RepID=UPI000400E51D|nr:hypothetical protein [Butyrivibrio sp. FC2001]